MSSPPLNKSCNRAGLFKRPVRSSASSRWPQALVQNRKQLRLRSFVLAAWPSCRGPRQPAANELGGGPVRHVLSPSSNAWPARRRQARPRRIPHPTSLRALHRVPSSVALRAHLPRPHSVEASGSAFPIKTGSAFPIGINSLHWVLDVCFREDDQRHWAGNSAENLGWLRKLALCLLKAEKSRSSKGKSINTRRLIAGWKNDYLLTVLAQIPEKSGA